MSLDTVENKYSHLGQQPDLLDPTKKIENRIFVDKLWSYVGNMYPGMSQEAFFARFPALETTLKNTAELAQGMTEQARRDVIDFHIETIIARNLEPLKREEAKMPAFIYEQLASVRKDTNNILSQAA